jgi:acetoin:2,6-dichlorophenolindophenol oxidoreductase subunit alpha
MMNNDQIKLYREMVRLRKFEEQACEIFSMGMLQGFVHVYIGQEAIAVGVSSNLRKDDYITSTHRGHGHLLAKGGDPNKMMAELCGRSDGYCRGKGGSMHISSTEHGMLGANGIVGAGYPLAVGAGLSVKMQKEDKVVVCYFGDGSTNEGTFHESLNMASLWKLPVVFVCENNLYGISCRQNNAMAVTDIADRAKAYAMPAVIVDGNDVLEVAEASKIAIERARNGEGPTFIECKTYKHHGHFEGDPAYYRPEEEVEAWMQKDPLPKFKTYLIENQIASVEELNAIEDEVDKEMEAAVDFAENSPFLDLSEAVKDVYSDIIEEARA